MGNIPLSSPPPRPASWWKTVPGQLALVVMLLAVILIAAGLLGIVGPRSI